MTTFFLVFNTVYFGMLIIIVAAYVMQLCNERDKREEDSFKKPDYEFYMGMMWFLIVIAMFVMAVSIHSILLR